MMTSEPNLPTQPGDQETTKLIKKECLRLLTRREHSQQEIIAKLSAKGFASAQINNVLAELTKQDWQDDRRYAESYSRMRCHKGFGPKRIGFELKQQGIENQTISGVLNATTDDWMAQLASVYRKKYPNPVPTDNNDRAKRTRFLLQRGFSATMVNNFINRIF